MQTSKKRRHSKRKAKHSSALAANAINTVKIRAIRRKIQPRIASTHPRTTPSHGPRRTINDRHKLVAAIVCILVITAVIMSGRLASHVMALDATSALGDESFPLPTELVIANTPSSEVDEVSSPDAGAVGGITTLSGSVTQDSAELLWLGDALSPSEMIEFAYRNAVSAASSADAATETATDAATEPEPTKALPPVPDDAPDATAELMASSVFYALLPDYPYITMNDLIALGEAVETPLYYAEPIDYSDEDLQWLARIIDHESGSDRYPDILQLLVGNVVLNRVAGTEFPNTVKAVALQRNAYGYGLSAKRLERNTPSARALENAKRLLDGARFLPPSVIFQANGRQGTGDCLVIDDELSGRVTYLCYAKHLWLYDA